MTVEKEHIHICDDAADADAGELCICIVNSGEAK